MNFSMNKKLVIEKELHRCETELSRLLMFGSDWLDKYKEWEKSGYDPTLSELYTDFITSPTAEDVKRYMQGAFNGSEVYRHIEINFIGEEVAQCIYDLFEWYYGKEICTSSLWDMETTTYGRFTEGRCDTKNNQFYLKYSITGYHPIQIAWVRPKEKIIEVIFTGGDDLYTSSSKWEALKEKCT